MKNSTKRNVFALFAVLGLVGCASQDAIPEVTERPKTDCALGALVDGPSATGRELGSCGSALEQLDDAPKKRK